METELVDSLDRNDKCPIDLGRHSQLVLRKCQETKYRDLLPPPDSDNTLIVRTGECSGLF